MSPLDRVLVDLLLATLGGAAAALVLAVLAVSGLAVLYLAGLIPVVG
jgi:hypothetical protein